MKKALSVILILCLAAGLCCCAPKKAELSFGEDWLMNTYCSITIYDAGREQLISDAFAYARSLENLLSRTVETSDIYKFNESGDGAECAPETAEIVGIAKEYYELSGGVFDISIGKVSKLWDFAAEDPEVPDAAEIDAAIEYTQNADKVYAKNGRLEKNIPEIEIDLGGIAKGYIADKTKQFLTEQGVTTAVINFGGNIVLMGSKPDGSLWRVGIEQPFSGEEDLLIQDRSTVGTVETSEASLVTSGTYERKFTAPDGTLYHHVLNPKTGYSVDTDLASATIIGPESARCDALSTSCLLLGSKKAREFMNSINGYSYVFIKTDGEIINSIAYIDGR